jgi:hypothetical protein
LARADAVTPKDNFADIFNSTLAILAPTRLQENGSQLRASWQGQEGGAIS